MATKTFYLLGSTAVTPNWFGNIQEGGTAPSLTGFPFLFTVAKAAVTSPYYRGRWGATAATASGLQLASSWIAAQSGPVKGTGSGATTAGDSFISPTTYQGGFASGNWAFTFVGRTTVATAVGRFRMRVWASANSDGTSARELTSSVQVSSTITAAAAGAQYPSTLTWAAPAINLNNEYLFFQVEWEETVAGTSNSTTISLFQQTSLITTTNFVPGKTVTATGNGAYALTGTDATLSKPGLPQLIAGISTAVSCAGPFCFGPIIDSQQPTFILGTGWQAFGQAAFITAIGTRFYPTISTSVTKIRCHVVQTGTTLADDVECRIYATTGSPAYPTGSPLGVSTAVDGATLDTTFEEAASWVEFTFSTPVAVAGSLTYCWELFRTGTRTDSSNPNLWYCNNPPPDPRYQFVYLDAQLGDPGDWKQTTDLAAPFEIHSNMDKKYFFFGSNATGTSLIAMKSDDPYSGWASNTTKTGFAGILRIRADHVPNTPYVDIAIMHGTATTSVATSYVRFDMGSETFGTTETVQAAVDVGVATTFNCDLVKRFSGEIVFGYNSLNAGGPSAASYKVRSNAGSYGSLGALATNNCTKIAVGLGWSDAVNFVWTSSATNKFNSRWLDKDNTTISTIGGTTTVATAWGGMVFGKEEGQSNFLVCAGDYSAQLVEANPPTFSFEAQVACNDTRRLFVDDISNIIAGDLTIYYAYVDSASGDVYMYTSTDYGATIGSASSIISATITQAPNNISIDGELYNNGRGGQVIPLVYNDAGTLKYNEYQVRALSTNKTLPADVPSSAYALVPGATVNFRKVGKSAPPPFRIPPRFWPRRINR